MSPAQAPRRRGKALVLLATSLSVEAAFVPSKPGREGKLGCWFVFFWQVVMLPDKEQIPGWRRKMASSTPQLISYKPQLPKSSGKQGHCHYSEGLPVPLTHLSSLESLQGSETADRRQEGREAPDRKGEKGGAAGGGQWGGEERASSLARWKHCAWSREPWFGIVAPWPVA